VRLAKLLPGDPIDVVAPSSPFDRAKFERGLNALRSIGLRPRHRDDLFDRHGHLAGTDERRSEELQQAFANPDSKAVILARGGYGLLRFATALERPPAKLLIGYSDATVLHEVFARAQIPSIHGPMLTQLGDDQAALVRLRQLLFGEQPGAIEWSTSGQGEAVDGVLRGGNLASLASMCGTPLQPKLDGAIVLLEDLNEPPYRLDRLLTQLLLAGSFERAKGFVVGDLTAPGEDPAGRIETVMERLAPLGKPISFSAPFGHAGRNQPVAFGVRHRLDAANGRLEQLDPLTT
jgi:muramoyltetrapeptide carboxypeptidase